MAWKAQTQLKLVNPLETPNMTCEGEDVGVSAAHATEPGSVESGE